MGTETADNKTFSMVVMDRLNDITPALPKNFNKPRFVQNAIALLNEKPEIQKYGQAQIIDGLLRGARLGLDFFNHECYLIGYGSQLQYQTSYIGQQKVIKKYSIRPVKHIYAEVVREGDEFSTQIINNEKSVTYKPLPFSSKPVVGAFAVCEFEDGGIFVETMNLEELEAVRKVSKMGNAGAWKMWTSEMQKKSVIRRLCKKIEIDFENAEQRIIFEADTDIETDPAELAKQNVELNANTVDFIDAEFSEV